MNERATELVVRKSVTVEASPEEAFGLYIHGIASWWPLKTHSVGQERTETVVMEGRERGRLYERTSGGEESDWGRIRVWDPPHRLVHTWHPGRGEEMSQEVEITFTPVGKGTRVDLEHRGWERLGDEAEERVRNYDKGWDGVLALYVQAANR